MARKRQVEADDEGLETGSQRTCVLTREAHSPDDLIRFVLAPDGSVVPDLDRKLPGRGVWLTATGSAVEKAVDTKVFPRAFRAQAQADGALAARVGELLLRRTSDSLALANKAGLVSAGFQQVESALEKGQVAVLLHGADAAEDGCHKLDRKFRAIQKDMGREACVVRALTVTEISLAMGRPSVVHAALKSGGLTERFVREAGRLVRFRASPGVSHLLSPDCQPRAEG